MNRVLLEIGCDGGSLTISERHVNGILFFEFKSNECGDNIATRTFIELQDSWKYLKLRYSKWYQLYLIQISAQMVELVKKDYIMADDKNEYTIDKWLVHLTGKGIGF